MNTLQINKIMTSDTACGPIFRGTWSIDKIPKALKFPACYVINTSPSWHPGTHWVALYINKKEQEYFCSLGSHPPPQVKRLFRRKVQLRKTRHRLQGLKSNLCGQYCVLYLLCRCRGYTLKRFLQCFTDYTNLNDTIVNDVFR